MDINQAFPSKYVKAADLKGSDVVVIITDVTTEDVGGVGAEADTLPVVSFQGMKKGMVLNRTNASIIADMYGAETNGWTGKPITLYPTETDFRGKMVACIRVRLAAPTQQQPPTPPAPQPPAATPEHPNEWMGESAGDVAF